MRKHDPKLSNIDGQIRASRSSEHSIKRHASTSVALATSVLASALMMSSPVAHAAKSTERCADIVKGGMNTCAVKSLGISCQGNAKQDNMPGAWIKVPTGTCGNIVEICAGSADAPQGTDAKKLAKACRKIADQPDASVAGGRLVDKHGEPL